MGEQASMARPTAETEPVHDPRSGTELGSATISSAALAVAHLGDTARRTASLRHLQRTAGNVAVAQLVRQRQLHLQRSGCDCVSCCGPSGESRGAEAQGDERHFVTPVQRQATVQRSEEHEQALADIQGHAMFNLLPLLEKLDPAIRADEQAGHKVGGPRLVVAMRAVAGKGNWQAFAKANTDGLASLPVDQIGDIMRYVGAPADVRAYGREHFDKRHDALVDPSNGTITLIFRVKIEAVEGADYTGMRPGTKGWDEANQKALADFSVKFKRVIEEAWSGKGSIKPTCPGTKVPAFVTQVSVQLVNSGEHMPFKVYGITSGIRSHIEKKDRVGRVHVADVEKKKTQMERPGQAPLTSEQVVVAHEFGHAIGLDHVACEGSTNACYGTTQEQYSNIMGGGMKVGTQPIGTGKGAHVHDALEPFEKIAERWGADVFPGALAKKCNSWGPA